MKGKAREVGDLLFSAHHFLNVQIVAANGEQVFSQFVIRPKASPKICRICFVIRPEFCLHFPRGAWFAILCSGTIRLRCSLKYGSLPLCILSGLLALASYIQWHTIAFQERCRAHDCGSVAPMHHIISHMPCAPNEQKHSHFSLCIQRAQQQRELVRSETVVHATNSKPCAFHISELLTLCSLSRHGVLIPTIFHISGMHVTFLIKVRRFLLTWVARSSCFSLQAKMQTFASTFAV
jgi:hypothetical protein